MSTNRVTKAALATLVIFSSYFSLAQNGGVAAAPAPVTAIKSSVNAGNPQCFNSGSQSNNSTDALAIAILIAGVGVAAWSCPGCYSTGASCGYCIAGIAMGAFEGYMMSQTSASNGGLQSACAAITAPPPSGSTAGTATATAVPVAITANPDGSLSGLPPAAVKAMGQLKAMGVTTNANTGSFTTPDGKTYNANDVMSGKTSVPGVSSSDLSAGIAKVQSTADASVAGAENDFTGMNGSMAGSGKAGSKGPAMVGLGGLNGGGIGGKNAKRNTASVSGTTTRLADGTLIGSSGDNLFTMVTASYNSQVMQNKTLIPMAQPQRTP